MSLLPITKTETHPLGTSNVLGIINANWQAIENVFDPALSSADSRYNAFIKALMRNATLPTGQASLEWDAANSKVITRLKASTTTYAATITAISQGAATQYCALTGNVTVAFDTIAAGRTVELLLEATGGPWTLTWPASMRWVAGAAPTSLASGKQLHVRFIMRTGAATGITAIHHVEP